MTYEYDLFIIGAGSGGVQAGRIAANLGARVAIAEERYLGGTCVNAGCIPKKLFAYAAQFRDDFEDARSYGWRTETQQFGTRRPASNWENRSSTTDRCEPLHGAATAKSF